MKKVSFRIIVIAVFAILVYQISDTLIAAGTFKKIKPHFQGEVMKVNLPIAGPEDITIDRDSGIAFISCDDRRTNQKNPGSVNGGIFIMNMNDNTGAIRNATPVDLTDFHPHGISLFKTTEGRTILFAISHRTADPTHVVERFEWRGDSLIHLETISGPELMTSPNDLAAIGERNFYVTNDHFYSEPGIGRTLEEYLQRSISYVNYFDGTTFRKVAENIAYANGIQVSPDKQVVYVASVTGRKVLVFDRASNNDLKKRKEIPVMTGADNIELDENGDVLIGCHPQMLKFVAHAKDPANFSPSQIIRINSKDFSVEELFLNDGTEYSGSTVAAPYRGVYLVGSVFEPALLILRIKN